MPSGPTVACRGSPSAIKCGVKSPAIRSQISVTKLTRHYDKLDVRNVIPSSGLGSIASARPYPREGLQHCDSNVSERSDVRNYSNMPEAQ
jgi:hypothetical protein